MPSNEPRYREIKAILLDIDDTLLDFQLGSLQSMQHAFADMGLHFEPEMFDVFRNISNKLWHQIETGELTREKLFEVRWNRILEVLGIKADGITLEKTFHAYLQQSAIPVDGALSMLQYLHTRGYLLACASNAPYEQQLRRLRDAGMFSYLQDVFASEKIGYAKPDKRFFQACHTALCHKIPGLKPAQMLMIGDSVTADIAGAQAFGMHTIWFCRDPALSPCVHAEHTITSLNQVCALL